MINQKHVMRNALKIMHDVRFRTLRLASSGCRLSRDAVREKLKAI